LAILINGFFTKSARETKREQTERRREIKRESDGEELLFRHSYSTELCRQTETFSSLSFFFHALEIMIDPSSVLKHNTAIVGTVVDCNIEKN